MLGQVCCARRAVCRARERERWQLCAGLPGIPRGGLPPAICPAAWRGPKNASIPRWDPAVWGVCHGPNLAPPPPIQRRDGQSQRPAPGSLSLSLFLCLSVSLSLSRSLALCLSLALPRPSRTRINNKEPQNKAPGSPALSDINKP
jgi:hypothetical protein